MSTTKRNILIAAALTGLLAGGMATKAFAEDQTPGTNAPSGDTGKHDCKGKNSCKGKGGCKTDANSCKGQNSCKGKGGCKGM